MEIGGAIRQSVTLPDTVRTVPSLGSATETGAGSPVPPPPNAESPDPPPVPLSQEVAEALAEQVEANASGGARIRIDEATDRVVVQILNSKDEVIKQFPPDDLLKTLARLREISGIIFDRQA